MDKKVLFNEALASLVEFAAANGNLVSTADVKVHFNNIIEDETQYQFIYEYLASSKIKVSDVDADDDKSITSNVSANLSTIEDMPSDSSTNQDTSKEVIESEEELEFIKMYLSELDAIVPVSGDELSSLLEKQIAGDSSVTNRLIESQLALVANIAENYRGNSVNMGDLIQEGNVALMMAIAEYKDMSVDFIQYVTAAVNKTLDMVVNSEISADRVGDRLAKKLNQLDDVTRDLNEKLGHVPSVEEIAEAMNISKEEVEMLLKTSLDTLSVNEDTGIDAEAIANADFGDAEFGDAEFCDASADVKGVSADDVFAPKEDPLTWKVNKK